MPSGGGICELEKSQYLGVFEGHFEGPQHIGLNDNKFVSFLSIL